jgi:hypothetical protein
MIAARAASSRHKGPNPVARAAHTWSYEWASGMIAAHVAHSEHSCIYANVVTRHALRTHTRIESTRMVSLNMTVTGTQTLNSFGPRNPRRRIVTKYSVSARMKGEVSYETLVAPHLPHVHT